MLDKTEDADELAYIEDALANLSFNEDLAKFDMLAVDPDSDLI